MAQLLSREEFKARVFGRDKGYCVVCGEPAVDAHHILDRKLFEDGGYYLDNGASLCTMHHTDAEVSKITVEYLRSVCGITTPVLAPEMSDKLNYDKWGRPSRYVKYPRTYHFPWSPNLQNDDRMLESTAQFEGRRVVMTEKMDGENTTMYSDHIHARSLDSNVHPSRFWVRGLWGTVQYDIPYSMRICGENLYAKHSIKYKDLPSYFMMFNVWVEDQCLSWNETLLWAGLLDLEVVPVLYEGIYDQALIQKIWDEVKTDEKEGYVVRVAEGFSLNDYSTLVGKYVRKSHVQSSEHWMHDEIEPNEMRKNDQGQGPS